jgi:DNA-directed RNA polymerase subunit M/transcription elongation factor TFIIS
MRDVMGLRCLLGHDFGPSGIVREHEEDGSEMVVTEREIRRCRRCGHEQVLSESTEVRAIRTEADVGVDPDARDADAVTPASSTQGPVAEESSPGTTALDDAGGAETRRDEATHPMLADSGGQGVAADSGGQGVAADSDGQEVAADSGGQGVAADSDGQGPDAAADPADDESNTSLIDRAEAGFDDPDDATERDPAEEDAVILDAADDPGRGYGEWPDSGGGNETVPTGASTDGGSSPVDDADGTDDDGTDANTPTDAVDGTVERSVAETAAEEDAELLDDGDGTDEEEGPTNDTGAASSWPTPDGDDEGFSAGDATAGGPDVAYGNELTPQSRSRGQSTNGRSHDGGYETSYLGAAVEERDGDGTIVSARSTDAADRPGVATEYFCPNCGHAWSLDSSLRTGDICPECQTGYIAERER